MSVIASWLVPAFLVISPPRQDVATWPERPPAEVASLRLVLSCAGCDDEARPTASLLWTAQDGGSGHGEILGLACESWDEGTFRLAGARAPVRLGGTPVGEDSWAVDVPLDGRGLPFRVTAHLAGHVALPGAAWPSAGLDLQVRLAFTPVPSFLREHPEWDPARAGGCDLVIPAGLEPPHVITWDGAPRAWLYLTSAPADSWTFQFVRPGGSLLERVSLAVETSREAGDLVVRLPVEAIAADAARAEGRQPPGARLALRGAGDLDPDACPLVAK